MSTKSHDKYAIFWVSMLNDEWFLSLTNAERGVWLQMILMAKRDEDSGYVRGRSWTYFGATLGCDGKTARRILGDFQDSSKVKIKEGKNSIEVFICKYEEHQHVRKTHKKLNQGKFQENSTTTDQTRTDQTNTEQNDKREKADQSNPASQEEKENQDSTESTKTALEQFWAWGRNSKNREAVHQLCGMIHYDQIAGDQGNHKKFLLDHVVKGEFPAWLTANSDKALESLHEYHGGSWLKYLKSWLDRTLADIRAGKRNRPTALSGGMSYEDEKARDAKHRSRSGGGLTKIGDM